MSSSERAEPAAAIEEIAPGPGQSDELIRSPGGADDRTHSASSIATEILRERARVYARVETEGASAPTTEVLLFKVRDEEYAAELRWLRGVVPVDGLSPVPCTPPLVAGVLNVRGQIVSVLDLAVSLGLAGTSKVEDGSQVLLVEVSQVLVGLLVDEVSGASELAFDALDQSLTGNDAIQGVAEARFVVLDLERLFSDERFGGTEIEQLYAGV